MRQTTSRAGPRWIAAALIVIVFVTLVASFLQTVRDYDALPNTDGMLIVLGVPIGAFTMSIAGVGIVFAVAVARRREVASRRNIPLGVTVLGFGLIGWYASYALAVDKVLTSLDPNTDLNCNVSLLVQCGANLESWQGSVVGFPNPLVGLVAWAAVIGVGCLLLAGIHMEPWFWIAFDLALVGALAFVIWFIGQSIFTLGTLCPWCMVTWAVTIPLFWAVTLNNARQGYFGSTVKRVLGPAYGWVPAISIACYIVVAVIAQLRLDVLAYL